MAPRPPRRAVGPPGARPGDDEPRVDGPREDDPELTPPSDDDERFRAERPPHHDRER
jgi:hypothetical protein